MLCGKATDGKFAFNSSVLDQGLPKGGHYSTRTVNATSLGALEMSCQGGRSPTIEKDRWYTCERSAMLAHPSTELVARAPCQLRRAHARSVRAARARLRQQRRLEVDRTRKRDVQTGGAAGALESDDHAVFFLLGGGFPVVNWGSISRSVYSYLVLVLALGYLGEWEV
jgi:hypothetical protein